MRIGGIVALLGLSITAVGQQPGTKSTVGSTSSDSVEKKISLRSEKVAKLEKEIESLQTTLKWVAPQVISMMPSKRYLSTQVHQTNTRAWIWTMASFL